MAKARRTPPLFEVLSGQERRTPLGPPGRTGVAAPGRPVEVRVPGAGSGGVSEPRIDTGAPQGERSRAGAPRGSLSPVVWAVIAVALALVAAAWYAGFHLGHDKAAKEMAPQEAGLPKSVEPGQTPVPSPQPGQGQGQEQGQGQAPIPQPDPGAGGEAAADPGTPDAEAGEDPRQAGNNYLHIVKLNWRDAEKAVAYLNRNGVKAAAVPDRKVDPKTARDKNLPHLVFALEAIPSDRFRASATQSNALIEKVKRVGQRFRKEEKGVSDFAEPYWAAYKGK